MRTMPLRGPLRHSHIDRSGLHDVERFEWDRTSGSETGSNPQLAVDDGGWSCASFLQPQAIRAAITREVIAANRN